jgi:carbon-monoxide dehydrogenase medium subunit
MYPSDFDYYRPSTVAEAVELLQKHSGAKILAGGHSLIPAMKYRVANPSALIDIGKIGALDGINAKADGDLVVGAMATHAKVAASKAVRENCAMVADVAGAIGDQQVRNRGTIGGSLAHADPAADYPTVIRCVGAKMVAIGPKGSRTLSSETFFTDLFTTALGADEVLTEVHLNGYGKGTGGYYAKFAHPASGYAVVGAAAMVTVKDGVCSRVSLCVGGATPNPVRCEDAEAALTGKAPTAENIAAAAALVGKAISNPMSDSFANGDYRAHLAGVMAKRALSTASDRAK